MKVPFPKRVKVGSLIYDVIHPTDFQAFPDCRGMCKSSEGKIEVSDVGDDRLKWKIFMHELVHAIDYVFCDKFFDEFETELISNAIISLVVDNKFIFKGNKIPKDVRIFGICYNVVNDYSFPELENTAAYVDHHSRTIYLAEATKLHFSKDFVKLQFIYCIIEMLPKSVFINYSDEFSERFPVSQLSNGLTEVFRDYDFESALKEVFKR
jgi:hypothetical protein